MRNLHHFVLLEKKENQMPIVYILVNEAMPGLIKIGHTNDNNLLERIKSLDTTAIPLPFECFYAVQVKNAVSMEKKLHQGLDDSRIRSKREFFQFSPEHAKSILSIAELMGGKNVTPTELVVKDPSDAQALKKAHNRRPRFHFGLLGIEPGEKLQFKKDSNIECEVANENRVSFRGEITSLSNAANTVLKEMGYDWGGAAAGPAFWCWKGDALHELRLQQEE